MQQQIDGAAMGSPLGPALANIFVEFVGLENEFPKFYGMIVNIKTKICFTCKKIP